MLERYRLQPPRLLEWIAESVNEEQQYPGISAEQGNQQQVTAGWTEDVEWNGHKQEANQRRHPDRVL